MTKYFIICPTGGLCNYLRVIFSYNEYAKSKNTKLLVLWTKTQCCNGYFSDYFEEVDNITFKYYYTKYRNIKISKENVHYRGCKECPNFKADYSKLKPKIYIQNIINSKIKKLDDSYIAVHIRRTDHYKTSKIRDFCTKDDEFIEFIEGFGNTKNLYIATDNKDTYEDFTKKYNDIVKFEYHKTNTKNIRQTELIDAIVDIYMCINASEFMGSFGSSFSNLIKNFRNKSQPSKNNQ